MAVPGQLAREFQG